MNPENLCQCKWILILRKNMGKSLSSKYGLKLLDSTKSAAIIAASRRVIHKKAEATDHLSENKITEKITRAASKSTCQDPK